MAYFLFYIPKTQPLKRSEHVGCEEIYKQMRASSKYDTQRITFTAYKVVGSCFVGCNIEDDDA